MYRSSLRRAFKPPNFIDKPHSEKSKVHESQDLTLKSKQTAARDVSKVLQPVKRRKLLVRPVSLTPPTAIQMQKEPPPVLPASCPDPGRAVAFSTAIAAANRAKEEESSKGYSRLGTTAEHEDGSPAKSLPELLPDVHVEQSSPVLGASMSLPGHLAIFGPGALPCGGAPLLDSDIVQRIQGALIPTQMPQTLNIGGEKPHHSLDRTMCDRNRSGCSLPGQWLAHGRMAGVTMPQLETLQKPAPPSPAPSPAELALRGAATLQGAANAAQSACPESTPARPVNHKQLAGRPRPAQQASSRKFVQRRLELQQARPVSLNSSGAAQQPVATGGDGLQAAILTHLDLQDEEMKEVLKSPEKQLGEVMRHPASLLGVTLDMAFLKSVCNV